MDIYNHRVHQFNPAIRKGIFVDVGDVVGCVAMKSENGLITALRYSLALLDMQTGVVAPIIGVEGDIPENRFNNSKCDSQGRFWFGSMCPDKF